MVGYMGDPFDTIEYKMLYKIYFGILFHFSTNIQFFIWNEASKNHRKIGVRVRYFMYHQTSYIYNLQFGIRSTLSTLTNFFHILPNHYTISAQLLQVSSVGYLIFIFLFHKFFSSFFIFHFQLLTSFLT